MGQIKLLISATLIGLFAIALVTFAINFGHDNLTRVNLANDTQFSTLNQTLSSELETFKEEANTSLEEIGKITMRLDSPESEGGAGLKVGPTTAISSTYRAVTSSFERVFGPEFVVFLYAFITILGFIAGLYIYKTIRGNPD